ncbi:beta strand repeat-containing protein, partial [Sphingorhabdus wooponensis]
TTVENSAMSDDTVLTLTGAANTTVSDTVADIDATGLTGTLGVTTADAAGDQITITTGTNDTSVTANGQDDVVTVDGDLMLEDTNITLAGTNNVVVTGDVLADVNATALTGTLEITVGNPLAATGPNGQASITVNTGGGDTTIHNQLMADDTLLIVTGPSDVDVDNVADIDALGLTGNLVVTNTSPAGGNIEIASNAATTTINNTGMADDDLLILSGNSDVTVLDSIADIDAADLDGTLDVTTASDTLATTIGIITGSDNTTVTASEDGDTVNIDAAVLADNNLLTIDGDAVVIATGVVADVNAAGLDGTLNVSTAADGDINQIAITAGTNATDIAAVEFGDSVTINATNIVDTEVLTITGAADVDATVNGADVNAGTTTGTLTITTGASADVNDPINVTAGSGAITLNTLTDDESVVLDATNVAETNLVDINGASDVTVNGLTADLNAADLLIGTLTIDLDNADNDEINVTTGLAGTTINDSDVSDTLRIAAALMVDGSTLTIEGDATNEIGVANSVTIDASQTSGDTVVTKGAGDGIETLSLDSGTGNLTLHMNGAAGDTAVVDSLVADANTITIDGAAASVTVNSLSNVGTSADADIVASNFTGDLTVNLAADGNADTIAVTLGAGNATVNAPEDGDTVNIDAQAMIADGELTVNGASDVNVTQLGFVGDATVSAGTVTGDMQVFMHFASDNNVDVETGSGNDNIETNGGNDVVRAGEGDNFISAGNGDNEVYAGAGDDSVISGSGDDYISVGDGNNDINAGQGDDEVLTGSGDDSISGFDGADLIRSGSGDDNIDGGDNDDEIYFDAGDFNGNDIVVGGNNDDTNSAAEFSPGYGDTIRIGANATVIDADFGQTTGVETLRVNGDDGDINTVTIGGVAQLAGIRWIETGDSTDTITLTGYNAGVTVQANGGDDVIVGGSGNDLFYGGAGSNSYTGAAGQDSFRIGNNGAAGELDEILDLSMTGSIADRIQVKTGGAVEATATTQYTADSSTWNYGTATILTTNLNVNLLLAATDGDTFGYTIDGSASTVGLALRGSVDASRLIGGSGIDILQGNIEDDILIGGMGNDQLRGGDGNDVYVFTRGAEHTRGEVSDDGGTADEMRFTSTTANDTLTIYAADAGVENVVIGTGIDMAVTANGDVAGADTSGVIELNIDARLAANGLNIRGNDGDNIIWLSTNHADYVVGNGGEDVFKVTTSSLTSADVIYGELDGVATGGWNYLEFTNAGTVVDSQFTGVNNVFEVLLADGTNNFTLGSQAEEGNVNWITTVGTGNDTINASAYTTTNLTFTLTGGNDTITGGAGDDGFNFVNSVNLTAFDTIVGGLGDDTLALGVGNGTVADVQFTNVSNVEVLNLSTQIGDVASYVLGAEAEQAGIRTISANDGDETLDVSSFTSNILVGMGSGDDTVQIGGGDVEVYLGSGDDQLVIAGSNLTSSDVIQGDDGDDEIVVTGINTTLVDAQLTGVATVDTLTMADNLGGSANTVTLGAEAIEGGIRQLNTGAGNDFVTLTDATEVSVDLGDGNDTVVYNDGFSGANTVAGGIGNDTLIVRELGQSATIEDGDFANVGSVETLQIETVGSTVTLEANANSAGIRNIIGNNGGMNLTVDFNATALTIQGGSGNDDIYININDAADDVINAGAGNDVVWAGGGDDIITGGSGADELEGDSGDDTFVLDGTSLLGDTMQGGDGRDTIRVDVSSDLSVLAADGVVNIEVFAIAAGQTATFGANTLENAAINPDEFVTIVGTGLGAAALVTGTAGNDTINLNPVFFDNTGTITGLTVNAGNGNDDVFDSRGNDTINLGGGNDFVLVQFGNDTVTGGTGVDTFEAGNGATLNVTDLSAVGNAADHLVAIDGGNIIATASSDWIAMATTELDTANSTITIQTTNFDIDLGFATVRGNGDAFLVDGSNSTIGLALFGSTGNDTLIGGSDDDVIYGKDGDDTLEGGAGADQLYGDTGDDTFVLLQGSDIDTAEEMFGEDGSDTLVLTNGTSYDLTGVGLDSIENLNANAVTATFTVAQINAFSDGIVGTTPTIHIVGEGNVNLQGNGAVFTYVLDTADAGRTLTLSGTADFVITVQAGDSVIIDADGYTGTVTVNGLEGSFSFLNAAGVDLVVTGAFDNTVDFTTLTTDALTGDTSVLNSVTLVDDDDTVTLDFTDATAVGGIGEPVFNGDTNITIAVTDAEMAQVSAALADYTAGALGANSVTIDGDGDVTLNAAEALALINANIVFDGDILTIAADNTELATIAGNLADYTGLTTGTVELDGTGTPVSISQATAALLIDGSVGFVAGTNIVLLTSSDAEISDIAQDVADYDALTTGSLTINDARDAVNVSLADADSLSGALVKFDVTDAIVITDSFNIAIDYSAYNTTLLGGASVTLADADDTATIDLTDAGNLGGAGEAVFDGDADLTVEGSFDAAVN